MASSVPSSIATWPHFRRLSIVTIWGKKFPVRSRCTMHAAPRHSLATNELKWSCPDTAGSLFGGSQHHLPFPNYALSSQNRKWTKWYKMNEHVLRRSYVFPQKNREAFKSGAKCKPQRQRRIKNTCRFTFHSRRPSPCFFFEAFVLIMLNLGNATSRVPVLRSIPENGEHRVDFPVFQAPSSSRRHVM